MKFERNKKITLILLSFQIALPVTPIIEHRDVSQRRPIQEMEFDLWSEPDSKPIFTFKLRPRLIQEGIGVKLICCVTGKPMPKVNHRCFLFCFKQTISFSNRCIGLKNVHN